MPKTPSLLGPEDVGPPVAGGAERGGERPVRVQRIPRHQGLHQSHQAHRRQRQVSEKNASSQSKRIGSQKILEVHFLKHVFPPFKNLQTFSAVSSNMMHDHPVN